MKKILIVVLIVVAMISCESNIIQVESEDLNLSNQKDFSSENELNSTNFNNQKDHENSKLSVEVGTKNEPESGNDGGIVIKDPHDKNVIEDDVALARELNSKGYELYNDKDYVTALDFFKESIEKDNNYLYAHYNYACTLGVLMKIDYPEWYESRHDIHRHLREVIRIRPDYIDKIIMDPDLDIIRKDLDYFTLQGYGVETNEDIRYLLTNLDWYINGPGVITPVGGATFFDDGTFRFSFMDLKMFSEGDFPINTDSYNGKYEITNGIITLYIEDEMLMRRTYGDFFNREVFELEKIFKGRLDQDGILHIDLFDYQFHWWKDEFSA